MTKQRVLVTGTSGFIAPHLANRLAKAGYRVFGLQRYVTGRTNYSTDSKINTVFANLCDHIKIRQLIRDIRPDYVFHLGAMSPVSYSYDRYIEANETNYIATINLAEACLRYDENLKGFYFAGTSEEYGNQITFPIKENARLYPNSPYAVSKVAATRYLIYMYEAYNFPMTVCRPFNTYGRTGTQHFVVERILTQMLNEDPVVRLGDPEPIRDLMFRTDHVDAYLSVLAQSIIDDEKVNGEIFNFCTSGGYSIKELVFKCAELVGYTGEIEWNTIPKRPLDIYTLIGDNNKAKSILGWSPKYDLESGLKQTISELSRCEKQ
jgi:dTDP-glucose 4,6-dehydratase